MSAKPGRRDAQTARFWAMLKGAGGVLFPVGSNRLTPELQYLVWTTILTLLIRIPWMINKVTVRGLQRVSGYPTTSEPLSRWAHRTWVAHEDAVQNLVIFAVLVGALHAAEVSNGWTSVATLVYFWARLTHFTAYALGVPRVKTAAFLAGFGAQLILAWQLVILSF